jgi:putative redox protein
MGWEIVHRITGPGRVEADFGAFVVPTDHPPEGDRAGRAPEPWCLFLASIGTCVASFVEDACTRRGLDPRGVEIVQRQELAEGDDVLEEIAIEIRVPAGCSPEDRAALEEAAASCTVKRTIEAGPRFRITSVLA